MAVPGEGAAGDSASALDRGAIQRTERLRELGVDRVIIHLGSPDVDLVAALARESVRGEIPANVANGRSPSAANRSRLSAIALMPGPARLSMPL
jgi:hypothetical protein